MALWSIQICDLNGVPLQNVTGIATSRQLSFKLNRPASLTFKVPGWDSQISTLHTDGLPYLCELARTVKAFRREVQSDGTLQYVPRFCGIIYQLEDDGDADETYTQITAFDPLQKLLSRFVYSTNVVGTASKLSTQFTATDVVQIAKTIVDRSAAVAGRTSVTTDTALGARFDVGTNYSVVWQLKPVAEALTDLTTAVTGGFDLYLKPINRTDGNLVAMQCWVPRAGIMTQIKFGWGTGVQNLNKLVRAIDGTKLGNSIAAVGNTAAGGDSLNTTIEDAPSIALYDRYEEAITYNDVVDTTQLGNLAAGDMVTSKRATATYTLTPQPDLAPPPWKDDAGNYTYDLGDYVELAAGAKFRQAILTTVRVYGFDLTLSDQGQEQVTSIYTASDA